jgi:hypothetical protein
MRRHRSAIAGVLVVLLMVQTTGCSSWQAVAQPLPAAVAQHPGRKLQVVLLDGRVIDADSAKADTDWLVTYQPEGVRTIPVSRVKSVEVRQGSAGKTIGLVLGIAAGLVVAGGVAFGIACGNNCIY